MQEALRKNPAQIRRIAIINKALTAIGYIAYPALLILLWFFHRELLAACIAVPAAGFIVVSAFRSLYNAPRPYEVSGNPPLIDKRTKGKSFPSRHTFSMFMIAFTWMTWCMPIGIALALCGCILGSSRVLLGIHYARDVIAGIAAAGACALLGYVLLPLA